MMDILATTGRAGIRLGRLALLLTTVSLVAAGCTGVRVNSDRDREAPDTAAGRAGGRVDSTGDGTPDFQATPDGAADLGGIAADADDVVAACAVGAWRSTGVTGVLDTDAAPTRLTGGTGIDAWVGGDGWANANFTNMQPITFATEDAAETVRGSFRYDGQAPGRLATDGGPDARAGTWKPAAPVDWKGATVAVDLTEPVRSTAVEKTPVLEFDAPRDERFADVARGLVNAYPWYATGSFECEGDSLVLTATGAGELTWTFNRLG